MNVFKKIAGYAVVAVAVVFFAAVSGLIPDEYLDELKKKQKEEEK